MRIPKPIFIALLVLTTAHSAAATISPGPGVYTFTGPVSLSGFPCQLTLNIDITQNGAGDLNFLVFDGNLAGSPVCNNIAMDFPWEGSAPAASLPTGTDAALTFDLDQIRFIGVAGTCGPPSGVSAPNVLNYINPTTSTPTSLQASFAAGFCTVSWTLNEVSGALSINNP